MSTILNKERLTLNFDSGLTFDLADAKVAPAPNISSITQKIDGESTVVDFSLIGDADVHSFREEKNYVVDIGFATRQDTQPKRDPLKPEAQQPATVPAPVQRSGETAPPSSVDVVKEAVVTPAAPAPVAAPDPPRARRSRRHSPRLARIER